MRPTFDPFVAMAEPVRRRIFEILASGEHSAGVLAAAAGGEFGISRTAVSKHLRTLREGGFVDVRAEEQWRMYRLTDEGIEALEDAVDDLRFRFDHRVGWEPGRIPSGSPGVAFGEAPGAVGYKGSGRKRRRGRRGRQRSVPRWTTPDD